MRRILLMFLVVVFLSACGDEPEVMRRHLPVDARKASKEINDILENEREIILSAWSRKYLMEYMLRIDKCLEHFPNLKLPEGVNPAEAIKKQKKLQGKPTACAISDF